MTLTPLAIALQGLGFTAMVLAVQGFANVGQDEWRGDYRARIRVKRRRRLDNDDALFFAILN
jgi:hypothetical protein